MLVRRGRTARKPPTASASTTAVAGAYFRDRLARPASGGTGGGGESDEVTLERGRLDAREARGSSSWPGCGGRPATRSILAELRAGVGGRVLTDAMARSPSRSA